MSHTANRRSVRRTLLASVVIFVGISAGVAMAEGLPLSGAIVIVDAQQGPYSDQYAAYFPIGSEIPPGGEFYWSLLEDGPGQITFAHDLGVLENVTVDLLGDPSIYLDFTVRAGAYGTNYTITSALVSFGAIVNPDAFATAGITVTDRNYDTATATGLLSGGKVFEARYNGSSVLASLVPSTGPTALGGTLTNSEMRPYGPLAATVGSMTSVFSFNLTPGDSASGTSGFTIVIPEPASLVLLAGGGLLLTRRRRG